MTGRGGREGKGREGKGGDRRARSGAGKRGRERRCAGPRGGERARRARPLLSGTPPQRDPRSCVGAGSAGSSVPSPRGAEPAHPALERRDPLPALEASLALSSVLLGKPAPPAAAPRPCRSRERSRAPSATREPAPVSGARACARWVPAAQPHPWERFPCPLSSW